MVNFWCNLQIHFASCSLHVLKKIISKKQSPLQYQLDKDKTEKTNKQTRKKHIKLKAINSAQHNSCNLVFITKFQSMS